MFGMYGPCDKNSLRIPCCDPDILPASKYARLLHFSEYSCFSNCTQNSSWVAVVTATDRLRSVHNRCVIELFYGVLCVVTLPFLTCLLVYGLLS